MVISIICTIIKIITVGIYTYLSYVAYCIMEFVELEMANMGHKNVLYYDTNK